jgi:hypothetical protein
LFVAVDDQVIFCVMLGIGLLICRFFATAFVFRCCFSQPSPLYSSIFVPCLMHTPQLLCTCASFDTASFELCSMSNGVVEASILNYVCMHPFLLQHLPWALAPCLTHTPTSLMSSSYAAALPNVLCMYTPPLSSTMK